jgi:hypothetical protein
MEISHYFTYIEALVMMDVRLKLDLRSIF